MRNLRTWLPAAAAAAAVIAAAATAFVPALSAWAAGETVGEPEILDAESGGRGMPSSNPRVHALLAAHPDAFVVICVAGCDGKPKAVQILPRPVQGRTAEYQPSAGGTAQRRMAAADESDDVVCLAGCSGRPGQVLQRITDLPPPPKSVPKPPAPPAKAAEPAPPPAPPPETGNEPLDIIP